MSSRLEFACLLIDAECHDVVGILIGSQQEDAGWIDCEIAWISSLGGFMSDVSQFACILVNCIDHYTIMTAIGSIDEFS